MTLHEPATLVTDLLLAALAGWLAVHLRKARPRSVAAQWWAAALACTAASALVGGLYHGFAPNFPPELARGWWRITLLIICITAMAMDLALLHEAAGLTEPARLNGPLRPWLIAIAFKAAAFASFALTRAEFVVVIIDYGLTLLAWLGASVALRRPWRWAMLLGIGLSLVAAAVQQLRIGLTASFNHNDLYHVIQAVALIAFHRAGTRFVSNR